MTLKSYGIETAADVNYHRVVAITGFGHTTAKSLLAWRQKLESAFRFDPNKAVDPADVAAIKVEFAVKRTVLEARARQTISRLQKAASDAIAIRANPGSPTKDAWAAWRNAKDFEREMRPSAREAVQLFSVGAVCVVSLLAYSKGRVSSPPYLFEKQEQHDVATSIHLPRVEASTGSGGPFAPDKVSGRPAETVPQSGFKVGAATAPAEQPFPGEGADGAKVPQTSPSPPAPSAPILPRLEIGPIAPAPDAAQPLQLPGAGVNRPIEATGALLDLLNQAAANLVQERLKALGYFDGIPDGIWGPQSRSALRIFRRTQGLGGNDFWDLATQADLMSPEALPAGGLPLIPETGEAQFAPPAGASRNPLNRKDAAWVQGRLRELGFISGDGDGIWGASSRSALQAFKAQSGMPPDETWDAATERKLSVSAPAHVQVRHGRQP